MITKMVIAIAGPVHANSGRLTNLDWVVDGAAFSHRCADVTVINDLTALGYSALRLSKDQLTPVVPQTRAAPSNGQALVVGIGTGFNVSPIIETPGGMICPAVEAGHTGLPLRIAKAVEHLKTGLSSHFETVEDLFSGQGRRRYLSARTDFKIDRATPYIENAGHADNAKFDQALDEYAMLIGHLLQDLQMAYLPLSGIFLAGGVARSSLIGARSALCSDVFTQPKNTIVPTQSPVWLIDDDAAALNGCKIAGGWG